MDPSSLTTTGVAPTWDVRMLYDGACMLCKREVDFLRAKDANRNRVDFVDIDAPDYDPSINAGIEYETAMGTIHAITRDGRVITGVEVFRELYGERARIATQWFVRRCMCIYGPYHPPPCPCPFAEAVGLGWIYAITRNKTVEKLANKVYDVWASNRLAITGRPELPVILAEKRTCRDNACEIPISAEERK